MVARVQDDEALVFFKRVVWAFSKILTDYLTEVSLKGLICNDFFK